MNEKMTNHVRGRCAPVMTVVLVVVLFALIVAIISTSADHEEPEESPRTSLLPRMSPSPRVSSSPLTNEEAAKYTQEQEKAAAKYAEEQEKAAEEWRKKVEERHHSALKQQGEIMYRIVIYALLIAMLAGCVQTPVRHDAPDPFGGM